MKKYIFLDKEGTITQRGAKAIETIVLPTYADIIAPLRQLSSIGYQFIILSNEPEIAEKLYTEKELNQSMSLLLEHLQLLGVNIEDYFYCPHSKEELCFCRKPLPGLFLQASEIYRIDFENSWMIGDEMADIQAGKVAGCKTILIDRLGTERNKIEIYQPDSAPDFIVSSFLEIAQIINNNNKMKNSRYS